jgi:hypothetical protein
VPGGGGFDGAYVMLIALPSLGSFTRSLQMLVQAFYSPISEIDFIKVLKDKDI